MQEISACKHIFYSFSLPLPPLLPTSFQSLCKGCPISQAWNAAPALSGSQGCWEQLFPSRTTANLPMLGGFIPQTFPQHRMTRLKITPSPAGPALKQSPRWAGAPQICPRQGSPSPASVAVPGEVHVAGEEKATRMNQPLSQPICLCLEGPHAEILLSSAFPPCLSSPSPLEVIN